MKIVFYIGLAIAAVGLIAIAGTGISLEVQPIGFGFLALGIGAFLISVSKISGLTSGQRVWPLILVCLGGGYFVWRAFSVGPIGLAVPDVVLVLTFLGVYFAVSSGGENRRKFFLGALLILGIANAGLAIVQVAGDQGWLPSPGKERPVTGFFGHYNTFAAFSNGLIYFCLSFAVFGKSRSVRILSGLLALVLLLTIFASNSRGGWVSLMVGGAVWLSLSLVVLKEAKSRFFGAALVIGILVLVVGLVSSFWMVEKLTDIRAEKVEDSSGNQYNKKVHDSGRIAFQQLAFEIFQESPVMGGGPRAYSYKSLELWDPETMGIGDKPPVFAHNEYLQALSDYGAVGLLIIIGLIFVHLVMGAYNAIWGASTVSALSVLQIGAIGGVVAMLAQCYFSFLLHTPSCIALIAVLFGILTLKKEEGENGSRPQAGLALLYGGFGLVISLSLLALGRPLAKSFLQLREANQVLESASDPGVLKEALSLSMTAGHTARDPELFEVAGRRAMILATAAFKQGDADLAKSFSQKAEEAFNGALKYNVFSKDAIAGLPRVYDSLGSTEAANAGHERAMNELWARELRLKVHYYAAKHSYHSALALLRSGDRDGALEKFREGQQRMARRVELIFIPRTREGKELNEDLTGWIAFMEARLLFGEADRVWKNARPRNPERAYALMLEAEKRYKASEAVVRDKNANWDRHMKQLQFNIENFKGGRVQPSKLSEEEVTAIVTSQEGLDSPPTTR